MYQFAVRGNYSTLDYSARFAAMWLTYLFCLCTLYDTMTDNELSAANFSLNFSAPEFEENVGFSSMIAYMMDGWINV